jgi:hypothetical protein
MKKLAFGMLALVLAVVFTSCPGRSSRSGPAYQVSDFPMRGNEVWGVLWKAGNLETAVAFQAKANPYIDKDGDVFTGLNVSGDGAQSGIAFIDSTDDTFVVQIKTSSLTFLCYAPMGSNWNGVAGTGAVTDGKDRANLNCAFGRSSSSLARKWKSADLSTKISKNLQAQ